MVSGLANPGTNPEPAKCSARVKNFLIWKLALKNKSSFRLKPAGRKTQEMPLLFYFVHIFVFM